jgi:Putative transposase
VAQVQGAGRGRTALRYLAAYVKKSAFSEGRLLGYDQSGRIVLSSRDSADGKLKSEALDPLELIRRWLLHVLPKGLVRVRHYGWLSPAAHKAFLRVRFLLGLGPYRIAAVPKSEPPRCPFCNNLLAQIARIAPQRGPPLCQAILKTAA